MSQNEQRAKQDGLAYLISMYQCILSRPSPPTLQSPIPSPTSSLSSSSYFAGYSTLTPQPPARPRPLVGAHVGVPGEGTVRRYVPFERVKDGHVMSTRTVLR